MIDIASLVVELGGMAQKRQLAALGASDLDLTNAVRSGRVIRARQGWYTTLPERDARVRAVRVGGRLTGLSAIAAADGWVADRRGPLHVSVRPNAARLRSQSNRFLHPGAPRIRGVSLHWESAAVARRGSATVVALPDALVRVVLDEPLEVAIAALDWALHTRRIDRIDFEWILLQLPERRRFIRDWVDESCESLPESLSRTRLRLRGLRVASQVRLGDFERIDLVVEECVGLEVDGERYHRERFEEDRRKDLDITIAGLHAIRPSARAVLSHWEHVERAVVAAVARASAARFGNSGVVPPRMCGFGLVRGRRHVGHGQYLNFRNTSAAVPSRRRGNTAADPALPPW